MKIKYESQRIAFPYFVAAMALFAAQILFGLIIGAQYIWPDFLFPAIPFNIGRMIHINLLVVWIIFGFMGAAYYLLPEEVEGEIFSVKLAWLHFWLFLIGGATAIVGYLFRIHDGREFLEQPFAIKVAIVIVVLMFIFNMIMTMIKGKRRTSISIVLLVGFLGLAVFYLFAFFKPANMVVDKYFWWWVVHMWVEGVWELIMAALLSFLLVKITGVDREVAEKWLYIIIGLTFVTGIIGTGHHYYWIGTPEFWQTWGAWFSAIEILPFAAMVAFTFSMVSKRTQKPPEQGGAPLDTRRGCGILSRGRGPGLHAYPAAGKLLHARHADDREPRTPRLLRGLRPYRSRDGLLRHAEHKKDGRAYKLPEGGDLQLLDDDHLDDLHSPYANGRGYRAGDVPARIRATLHGDAELHGRLLRRTLRLRRNLYPSGL